MTKNGFISKKLRISGILIILGLLVEALSLLWNHPLSFIAFVGVGGLAIFIGIVTYLLALISLEKRQDESAAKISSQGTAGWH
jgi:hypothetical protein